MVRVAAVSSRVGATASCEMCVAGSVPPPKVRAKRKETGLIHSISAAPSSRCSVSLPAFQSRETTAAFNAEQNSKNLNSNDPLLHFARHQSAGLIHEQVDFRANPELGQIHAGLDGEAGPRKNFALVVGFEIVHVRTGAVDFFPNGMAGAMEEIFTQAGAVDMRARCIVDFEAAQLAMGGDGILDALDGFIARGLHDVEHVLNPLGNFFAAIADPGDVVVDAAGLFQFSPHVDQHQVAAADLRARVLSRVVVRIGCVSVHSDVGTVIDEHAFLAIAGEDELLDVPLGDALARALLGADTLEGLAADAIDAAPGFEMRFELFLGPARLEKLNQVRRGGDFDAQRSEEHTSEL